jgi:Astacin (Peptidase family M12A)/Bacterial Ig-like domain (group 2)
LRLKKLEHPKVSSSGSACFFARNASINPRNLSHNFAVLNQAHRQIFTAMQRRFVMKNLILSALGFALALTLTACPDSPPSSPIFVSTANSQVLVSDSVIFSANDSTGKPLLNSNLQWSSGNPTIASVNADGIATGVSVGETTIWASLGNVKSAPLKLNVYRITKGSVSVFSPTALNPGRVLSLPVELYKDYALYQGDIAFPIDSTAKNVNTRGNIMAPFNGLFVKRLPWPSRTLPYYLEPSLPQEIKNLVAQTAALYKLRADINLVQISTPPFFGDYVHIASTDKPNICGDSQVGRRGGPQTIHFKAGIGCSLHSYIHEFGHALGLWHEQARSDRNSYITVNYNNIKSDLQDQYDITDVDDGYPSGAYDYASVMHYASRNSASMKDSNGELATFDLVNKNAYPIENIGTQDDLSSGDILALNALYNLPVIDLSMSIGALSTPDLVNGGNSSFSVTVNNKGPKTLGTYYLVLKSIDPATITYTGNKYNCQKVLLNYLSCAVNGNVPPNTHVTLSGFRVAIADNYAKSSLGITAVLSPDGLIPIDETKLQSTKTFSVIKVLSDQFEVNDTIGQVVGQAGFVGNNFGAEASLHNPTDTDFYPLNASDADPKNSIVYSFSTFASDIASSLELTLYDNNFQEIASGSDTLQITKPTKPGEHYYVLVRGTGITRYHIDYHKENNTIPVHFVGLIDTWRFLSPNAPIEKTLLKAFDFFDVKATSDPAGAPAIVQLRGENLKLSLFDLNGNQVAEGIASATDAQNLTLPVGAGQEFVLQVSRAQDDVTIGDLSVHLPTAAYQLELH